MAQKFYAVKNGKQAGIYRSWEECRRQVHGYPGALYKSFSTLAEAMAYLEGGGEKAVREGDCPCHIYVDGSYVSQRYGWGFAVYLNGALTYTENGAGQGEAAKLHNVAGEIEATLQAVKWAQSRNIAPIVIHHDYIGISEWAQKRWKTNNEITREYARYMESRLDWVTFVKVAGHSGDPGNDLADTLAKQALGIV